MRSTALVEEGKKEMHAPEKRRVRPELKELVIEASRALARLDAGRLEEMALSCQALNRELALRDPAARAMLACQAREAARDMAIFLRVLEATRANLSVMNRLRELREGRLEYSELRRQDWSPAGCEHGDN